MDHEEDECGDREDQCDASCVESWVEARRERSGRGGSRETTKQSCFFIVGGVNGAAIVPEKGGV